MKDNRGEQQMKLDGFFPAFMLEQEQHQNDRVCGKG